MSIYIKGMEMPIEKSRIIQIYPDGSVRRLDGGVLNSHFNAIPVPPHGRLIDADEVIGHLFNGEQCLYSWDEIEESVDATSTVIPADPAEEGDHG